MEITLQEVANCATAVVAIVALLTYFASLMERKELDHKNKISAERKQNDSGCGNSILAVL